MPQDAHDQAAADAAVPDDEARGDDVYQPVNADVGNRPDDELDLENAIGADELDDMLDQGYAPPDRPHAVTRHGTTGREQSEGESLDERLAQEVPDTAPPPGDGIGDLPGGDGEPVDQESGATRAGRLAPVDEPSPRRNVGVVARDVGIDGGAAAAEEAAMHVDTGIEDEGGAGAGEGPEAGQGR
ncbi:DUF5709 domain-containing protein [Streptomyces sp. NPDC093600]|uniref:DUF5709 domain-containing protein n=1 Tax=Streptomyces sp. NPDC093600 TaxID=3366047 RepID=UPI0037F148AB